jgi:hypothetical protein
VAASASQVQLLELLLLGREDCERLTLHGTCR